MTPAMLFHALFNSLVGNDACGYFLQRGSDGFAYGVRCLVLHQLACALGGSNHQSILAVYAAEQLVK